MLGHSGLAKQWTVIGDALPSPFLSLPTFDRFLKQSTKKAKEHLVFVLDEAEASSILDNLKDTSDRLADAFCGEMILFVLGQEDRSLLEEEYKTLWLEIREFTKERFILNELESECASFLEKTGLLQFSLLGNDEEFLLSVFRRLLPTLHPFQGEERYYFPLSSSLAPLLEIPLSLGLVEESSPPCKGGIYVIANKAGEDCSPLVELARNSGAEAIFVMGTAPKKTISLGFNDCLVRFAKRDHQDERCLEIAYRYLAGYNGNLETFALPMPETEMPLALRYSHPWQYYGAGVSLFAYGYALGERYPEPKSFASRDKGDAYRFIFERYLDGELYSDMAEHQHNGWMLRTLMHRKNALEDRKDLLISFDDLVSREFKKLYGLKPEEAFPIDKVFPDYLVPFAFLFTKERGA